ncbi:MAG: hypothetical protein KJ065_26940 [Anaerolineae bacterium]|nr:hypothetical protein [Anaerolineae bacterium]MCL4251819.1 hypothetical protein [Anaerolineae bacterium]
MIKNWIFALLMITSLLLASCGADPVDVYDWCYVYDFTSSDYSMSFIGGSWVNGQGLTTDASGYLAFNWVHDQLVSPTLIRVTVIRPAGTVGEVNAQVNAIAFGVAVAFDATLPADMNEVTLNFTPQTAGENGMSVNAAMQSSQPLTISSLEVRGNFANPFPVNYCGLFTPTETPTDVVPGETYVPSASPTIPGTATPSPTATPEDTLYLWIGGAASKTDFRFTYQVAGYTNVTTTTFDFPVYYAHAGVFVVGYAFVGHFDGVVNCHDTNCYARPMGASTGNLVYADQGTKTFCEVYSNLFSLPNATTDAIADTFCLNNFGIPDGAVSFPTNQNVNQSLFMDYYAINIPSQGLMSGTMYAIMGARGWVPTQTPTTTPYVTLTPTNTPTSTPSRTPVFFNTPTPRSTQLPTISVATHTPNPTTTPLPASNTPIPITPSATRTQIPLPTALLTPTIDPNDPNPNPNTENEAEWDILAKIGDFFTWVQNAWADFQDWLSSLFNWLAGTAANIGTLINNAIAAVLGFLQGILDFFRELWAIGDLLLRIIFRLVELFVNWLVNAIARITALISSFFSAPATPIPGLPLCYSNPFGHDLCSVYYLLQFTLLARGTPGELIIPIVVIAMNIGIILLFVKFVMRLLRRGEGMPNG